MERQPTPPPIFFPHGLGKSYHQCVWTPAIISKACLLSTRISDCAPLGMHCISVDVQGKVDDKSSIVQKWTHWDLNPGPSACEADVIPLHHVPSGVKLQQIVGQSPGRADRLDWHPARILLLARFIGPAYCLGLLARFIALRWQTQSPWSA